MSKKIKVNIPGFGERYCSNNVEYKLSSYVTCYVFYKKGTNIFHNEYGPAIEWKDGDYRYYINNKAHRLGKSGIRNSTFKITNYCVIGKIAGNNKKEFIKNLSNILIPKEYTNI